VRRQGQHDVAALDPVEVLPKIRPRIGISERPESRSRRWSRRCGSGRRGSWFRRLQADRRLDGARADDRLLLAAAGVLVAGDLADLDLQLQGDFLVVVDARLDVDLDATSWYWKEVTGMICRRRSARC